MGACAELAGGAPPWARHRLHHGCCIRSTHQPGLGNLGVGSAASVPSALPLLIAAPCLSAPHPLTGVHLPSVTPPGAPVAVPWIASRPPPSPLP